MELLYIYFSFISTMKLKLKVAYHNMSRYEFMYIMYIVGNSAKPRMRLFFYFTGETKNVIVQQIFTGVRSFLFFDIIKTSVPFISTFLF